MSHFAKIEDGIVTQVVVAEQSFIKTGVLGSPTDWVQTSYNDNFRKQFAGIGFTYNEVEDIFISQAPFDSWLLDDNHDWHPPVPYPTDDKMYNWDEATTNWIEITGET